MALDWIKMRCNLWDDPRVSALVEATDTGEATIIGGLYWLWATADQHTQDGVMHHVSIGYIDRKTGIKGFGAGLVTVGWVEVGEDGSMRLARFAEHNGQSGKTRAATAKRVAKHRVTPDSEKCNGDGVTDQLQDRTQALQDRYLEQEQEQEVEKEESKSKEIVQQAAQVGEDAGTATAKKKPQTAIHFPRFWAAYPVKKGKVDAEKKWKLKGCDEMADLIITHVRMMEAQDDQWRAGFIPHGSTYVNGEHWFDEPTKHKDTVSVTAPAPAAATFGPSAALARSESKLENEIGYIRQQFNNGAFGEGKAAVEERDRLIASATQRSRGE